MYFIVLSFIGFAEAGMSCLPTRYIITHWVTWAAISVTITSILPLIKSHQVEAAFGCMREYQILPFHELTF
jgi:hypothetical protein